MLRSWTRQIGVYKKFCVNLLRSKNKELDNTKNNFLEIQLSGIDRSVSKLTFAIANCHVPPSFAL